MRRAALCLQCRCAVTHRASTLHLYQSATRTDGAVPSPRPGPLAAWMPPRSLHGWIHGVSGGR
ncbi:hypothetical protein EIQ01_05970 [Xanthomonas campestris pv. raphani]